MELINISEYSIAYKLLMVSHYDCFLANYQKELKMVLF